MNSHPLVPAHLCENSAPRPIWKERFRDSRKFSNNPIDLVRNPKKFWGNYRINYNPRIVLPLPHDKRIIWKLLSVNSSNSLSLRLIVLNFIIGPASRQRVSPAVPELFLSTFSHRSHERGRRTNGPSMKQERRHALETKSGPPFAVEETCRRARQSYLFVSTLASGIAQ
jgi:hypothetical protein